MKSPRGTVTAVLYSDDDQKQGCVALPSIYAERACRQVLELYIRSSQPATRGKLKLELDYPLYEHSVSMLKSLAVGALLASVAIASYDGNLNYRSPSTEHAGLGIDVPKIMRRNLAKRDNTAWDPASLNFTHGIASGDPYPNSVILWTRIAPMMANDDSNVTVEGTVPFYSHETERYIKTSSNPICLNWKVSTKEGASGSAIASGKAYTTSDIDYTVKVEARGLKPFTTCEFSQFGYGR